MSEAIRSGMFWVIAASLATSGTLTTALAFHQIAILGEQGLTPLEAAASFLPQTVTGILATVLTGSLIDRTSPKLFVVFSMTTLSVSLLMLPLVEPGWTAVLYGLILGAAGGSLRGMEAAAYVRYYGTKHIGSIRGVATSISLASTAFGPLALALGLELTGGFTIPAMFLAVMPLLVVAFALFAPRRITQPQNSDSTVAGCVDAVSGNLCALQPPRVTGLALRRTGQANGQLLWRRWPPYPAQRPPQGRQQ